MPTNTPQADAEVIDLRFRQVGAVATEALDTADAVKATMITLVGESNDRGDGRIGTMEATIAENETRSRANEATAERTKAERRATMAMSAGGAAGGGGIVLIIIEILKHF